MHAAAIATNDTEFYRAWGDLLHSVTNGESAFEHVFGMGLFEYMEQHPSAAASFHDALANNAAQVGASTAAACDFSAVRKLSMWGAPRVRCLPRSSRHNRT
jgi:O-methyltransferase domain